jgi:hypothetical protein
MMFVQPFIEFHQNIWKRFGIIYCLLNKSRFAKTVVLYMSPIIVRFIEPGMQPYLCYSSEILTKFRKNGLLKRPAISVKFILLLRINRGRG